MTIILSRWILIYGCILFLLSLRSTQADSPSPPPDPYGPSFNPSMGVVIIVLIGALFFMGFFSVYIRHCSQQESVSGSTAPRGVFMGSVTRARRPPRGLDRAVIESFPTFDYSSVKELKIGKSALECAVCLNEFDDDDMLRLLPKCDHVFHPECIDAWLVAHTTCPVCRTDLVPRDRPEVADVSFHVAPEINNVEVVDNSGGNITIMVDSPHDDREVENQEAPLQGNRTMRRNMSFGRPRWLGRMMFARSFSTGHVAVKKWEDMERFTLRLPEEVRKQLVSGKLERTTSLVVLPRETSCRRGYRTGTGFGEGSSRGGRFGMNRSDRWIFSLVPPFFSRGPSVKSPNKVMAPESRQGSLHGSVRSESNRVPV